MFFRVIVSPVLRILEWPFAKDWSLMKIWSEEEVFVRILAFLKMSGWIVNMFWESKWNIASIRRLQVSG